MIRGTVEEALNAIHDAEAHKVRRLACREIEECHNIRGQAAIAAASHQSRCRKTEGFRVAAASARDRTSLKTSKYRNVFGNHAIPA